MKNKRKFIFALIVILSTMTSTAFANSKSVFPSGTGAVVIVNRFIGYKGKLTFDGRYFKNGDQVHVYSDSSCTNQIGETPMKFNQYLDDVIVQVPNLGQSSGSLYVTLSDVAGDDESDPVKVDYRQEVTVTNNVDISDTVAVTGLVEKDVVKVYSSDARSSLGTATASKDGDVVVSLSKQLTEPNDPTAGGSFTIFVSVKSDGQTEGVKMPVTYSPAVVSVAPAGSIAVSSRPADVIVTNNLTTTDTVTFLNLKAKDVVNVYAAGDPSDSEDVTYLHTRDSTIKFAKGKTDASGTAIATKYQTVILGTATATKDGDLVVKLTKQLSESSKSIYVSVKNYNLHESPVTLVQYYRAGETPTTSSNSLEATITPSTYNVLATSNMAFVSGVNADDIVTVYDSSNNKLIGIATVASGNNYVIVNFIATSHSIYLKNKNPDKLISDSSSPITLP